jgi:hypothetical protein
MKIGKIKIFSALVIITILVIASMPAQAATVDGGTCQIIEDWLGNGFNSDMRYNGSAYVSGNPMWEFWDDGDDLNFTIYLNLTNSDPILTYDFVWTISVWAECRDGYTIYGGDTYKVDNDDSEYTVSQLGPSGTDDHTMYVEIYNVYYYSSVDISFNIIAYIQDVPQGAPDTGTWRWIGIENP